MKVGIMSMQRIKNFGSFLQAYGLKQHIEQLGHKVVFVDYAIGESIVRTQSILKHSIAYRAIRKIYRKSKKLLCQSGKDTPRPLYETYNSYLTELGVSPIKRTENLPVDVLVIGSDEVFNCLQENPDVGYSPQLFGEGVRANKVISYAASCGFTTVAGLKRYGKYDEVSGYLKRNFSAISVRDENSAAVVKQLTGNMPEIHIDPVLTSELSNRIVEKRDVDNYIIIYSYRGRFSRESEIEAIKEFARKRNLKTVSVGNFQEWTDIKLSANPFELLGYFKNANYIVTDTFHGTIFSIITRRPFATICRSAENNNGYSNVEKLSDLLNRTGLAARRVDDICRLGEILETPIDFAAADELRKTERERTMIYLKTNIK